MSIGIIQISEGQSGPQVYFEECTNIKDATERFHYLSKVCDSMNQFLVGTNYEFLKIRKEYYKF